MKDEGGTVGLLVFIFVILYLVYSFFTEINKPVEFVEDSPEYGCPDYFSGC